MRLKQHVGDIATKQIEYYGHSFMVPKSTTHVATDGDGQMYAYIGVPRYDNELDVWLGKAVVGVIAMFDLQGTPSCTTCRKIK